MRPASWVALGGAAAVVVVLAALLAVIGAGPPRVTYDRAPSGAPVTADTGDGAPLTRVAPDPPVYGPVSGPVVRSWPGAGPCDEPVDLS